MTSNNKEYDIDRYARSLWDYLNIECELKPSDFVLALGSHDLRVASSAAELYLKGLAQWFIASGGHGKVTSDLWKVAEGTRFAEVAQEAGVPADRIIVETRAQNTGDNIALVRDLLIADGRIPHTSGILVSKPYMKRRALATACKQWPDVIWGVAGPNIGYGEYPTSDVPKSRMINLMVGDLQRMKVFAEQGFQIPQEIPVAVWAAYENLVAMGFDQFVIKTK
jgi:uncharacterized SAM-binding protein YcdF (DUF218 family)